MTTPVQGPGAIGSQFATQAPRYAQQVAPNRSFSETFEGVLGEVQGLQDDANDTVSAFLRGDPVQLHDVMAAVEEAGIALDMLIEVRNRLTEAYRSVVNMQT